MTEPAEEFPRFGLVTVNPVPRFTLARFHNALRIMRSIDLHELQDKGVLRHAVSSGTRSREEAYDWERWLSFRVDPYKFFITCDDDVAVKIFEIVESRQSKDAP